MVAVAGRTTTPEQDAVLDYVHQAADAADG